MPLRDFTCNKCGHDFESFVKRDPVLHREEGVECRSCGSADVRTQVSAPGGYKMRHDGASTRPRHAGSFLKGKK